jgi:dihydropyrimidinase
MRVDYSAYEGWRVRGVTETVLSRGRVIVENNEFKGKSGAGRFIKRGTFTGR